MFSSKKRARLSAAGIFAFLLAAVVALGLAGMPSLAQAQATAAACPEEMRQLLQDRAAALRVRDSAMASQIITPPEPSAGLTCMDQAMGVAGRLGAIFSDVHQDIVPPANTNVFVPPLAYPDFGAGQFLLIELNNAVAPVLGGYLQDNFGGALASSFAGSLFSGDYMDMIGRVVQQAAGIGDAVGGFVSQLDRLTAAANTVQSLASVLNLPLPSGVIMGTVSALETAQGVLDQLMGGLMQSMNASVQPMVEQVMGEIMSPANDINCDNMATYWSEGDAVRGIVPVQGGGPDMGAPFIPLTDLLTGNYTQGGVGFMNQLHAGGNMDVLDRALQHMTTGALSEPGRSPIWQPSPDFSRNATTAEILREMRGE